MADHSALYPLIAPEVMGCPSITIDSAINRAAAEFCDESLAWQQALAPIALTNGVDLYQLVMPAGAALVVLRDVRLDGRPIKPAADARGFSASASGAPGLYAQPTRRTLQLYPKPADLPDGSTLALRAALKPTLTATSLPDELVDDYYEALAEGAKAFLKRVVGQAWSDPDGAAACYQLFQIKTSEARIDAECGHVSGSMQVTPRAFGG